MDNSKDHSTDHSKKRRKKKKNTANSQVPISVAASSTQGSQGKKETDNLKNSSDSSKAACTFPLSKEITSTADSTASISTDVSLNTANNGATSKKTPNLREKCTLNEPSPPNIDRTQSSRTSPHAVHVAAPLFQWSRKENNLNLAVEENHNNLIVETNSRNFDSNTNITEKKSSALDVVNRNQCCNANSTEQASGVKSKLTDSGKGGGVPPADMKLGDDAKGAQGKTKAQLKAERKAAFEAERASQLAGKEEEKQAKSKAELRAERRSLQEAQRSKKNPQELSSTEIVPNSASSRTENINDGTRATNASGAKEKLTVKIIGKSNKQEISSKGKSVSPDKTTRVIQRKLRLFSHLPQHIWNAKTTATLGMSSVKMHPSVIRVGLQMAQGLIIGSNARCVASLAALRNVIKDYSTPPQKELSRELDAIITSHVGFLKKCRPLAASTANAVKRLKWEVTQLDSSFSDLNAKDKLNQVIDTFIEEDILLAKRAISDIAGKKIKDGDVILTYACSSLVKQVLYDAHVSGKRFRVIVVDSRPGLEGCEMLRFLANHGVCCTYVWINAVSYVIKEVTKVILGCHSLQANGYVMSRVGSSQVALVAHSNNVPVLVCCETYKFCERVHTDSFICNELGDPEKLVTSTPSHKSCLGNWKDISSLSVVSLTYDVMPAHLVTSVITELEMLPCTSVPVILRVKHVTSHEINEKQRLFHG